jgi:hypothetical protein
VIKLSVEFDFDIDDIALEPKACNLFKLPHSTKTKDLTNSQYDHLCKFYKVPDIDAIVDFDVDPLIDEETLFFKLSEHFGWPVTIVEKLE